MSELRQERDRISGRTTLWVGIVTVVIIALTPLVAALFLRGPEGSDEASAPQKSTPRIGIVEQTLLESNAPGQALEQSQRHELEHWRWLDPKHESAQIPIERAMSIVEGQHR